MPNGEGMFPVSDLTLFAQCEIILQASTRTIDDRYFAAVKLDSVFNNGKTQPRAAH